MVIILWATAAAGVGLACGYYANRDYSAARMKW